jgi:transposase
VTNRSPYQHHYLVKPGFEAVERENLRLVPIKTEDPLDLQALPRVRWARGTTDQRDPSDARLPAGAWHPFSQRTSQSASADARDPGECRGEVEHPHASPVRFSLAGGERPGVADPWSGSTGLERGRIGHGERVARLGLVPRQWSTAGKVKLLGISKRGNPYLRKMFIHGARAAVVRVQREGSSLGTWRSGLETRGGRNVVIVATANKLARISWAVLASGNDYHGRHNALAVSN